MVSDALGMDKSLREYKIGKATKKTLTHILKPSNKIKSSGKGKNQEFSGASVQ